MSPERWERTVRRLEREATTAPRRYQRRVALLAGLGYAYLLTVTLLLVGGAVAILVLATATAVIVAKFALPLLAIAYTVVRSLLGVRIPEPEGIEVDRGAAPKLWALVDRVRERLDAPPVARLVIDEDLNAGVVQVPRARGLLGQANHLVLGLPMLQALSPDELEAVLAHEFGHLSGNHGRFGGRIYRARKRWVRLLEALEARRKPGVGLFRRFFEWYAPYFGAYSFALARQNEYVADGAAAEAVGARGAAAALARTDLAAWELSRWWPKLYARANHEPQPPRSAYTELRSRLPLADDADLDGWLATAMAAESDLSDTHPSLHDRVSALGIEPADLRQELEAAPATTAATTLLGPLEQELVERFDHDWLAQVTPAWLDRHREAQDMRARLQELEARAEDLVMEERLVLAQLTEELEAGDALARYEAVLVDDPRHAVANFRAGVLMLRAGDEQGIARIETAMDADRDAVVPGCELIVAHLTALGRDAEAEPYRRRAQQELAELDAAQAERATDVDWGELDPPGLDEPVLSVVRETLAGERVGRAWLARRRFEHYPDAPAFVLVVRGRGDKVELAQRLADSLPLPEVFVWAPGWWPFGAWRKITRVPGSAVFER